MQEIKQIVSAAIAETFGEALEPELSRPEDRFGDYATNVALQLAGKLGQPPREIGQRLAEALAAKAVFASVEVAGPGFINLTLKDGQLLALAVATAARPLSGQEILVEFGDPNPFKQMHIGHLYSYVVGDSICRLLASAGATVRRLSYHGDVGLHVAKAIWGRLQTPNQPIGQAYTAGAQAYETDQAAKAEIDVINQQIYARNDERVNQLYEQGRTDSFRYFDEILSTLGIKTDRRYLESESTPVGLNFVRQNTGRVFTESDGAIVYQGGKVGLHTRVFITSQGLPTYEAKDLGLAELKKRDYPGASRSIIITAHEQAEYFKVMLAALSEFDPDLAALTTHLSHGFLSLSTGKMSSRTGQVFSAAQLLHDVKAAAAKQYPDTQAPVDLAAVKYGLLKHRLGADIVYDIAESISLEGNSGPYLQYAHARACSLLKKAAADPTEPDQLDSDERALVRKLSEYPEALQKSLDELKPHHVCTYLYELAQSFNRFYEKCRILGDNREAPRLYIVKTYSQILASGLNILGIEALEEV